MFEKLKGITNLFKKTVEDDSVLTQIDTTEDEEDIVIKDEAFQKNYNSAKSLVTLDDFKKFTIELVMDKLNGTTYAPYKDFLHEIKFFLHYLFLVIEDDYNYGSKIFQKRVTQLDNYIFSSYRKKPHLEKNIKKLITLSHSKRFVDPPKENILSYFVFLEENGIEIVDILEDFTYILNNGGTVPEWIFNSKEKQVRKSYNKEDIAEDPSSGLQTFNSIYSTVGGQTRLPRIDITQMPTK